MSDFSKRALRWAAPVALVGAVGLAACGDGDNSDAATASVAGRSYDYLGGDDHRVKASSEASGLDNHLDIRANEIATREQAERAATARLTAQAEQYQAAQAARLAAQAEQFERQAHLDGQANTYGSADVPTNSDADLPNAFEAGNRAVAEQIERQAHLDGQAKAHSTTSGFINRAAMKAQADAYVESLEARAESISSTTSNRAAVKAQADAYVDSLEARAADADFSGRSYRAALKAQADAYVESLEARAESSSLGGIDPDLVRVKNANSSQVGIDPDAVRVKNANSSGDGRYDDEFVPGTRHMPMR